MPNNALQPIAAKTRRRLNADVSAQEKNMRRASLVVLLLIGSDVVAQQYNIPKDVWLANLKTIMSEGLCNGQGSPFRLIYKGAADECIPEVGKLFDLCAKGEPRVILPEKITSVPEANNYGRVMAECVSAHYQGGAALDAFYRLQDLTNKQTDH